MVDGTTTGGAIASISPVSSVVDPAGTVASSVEADVVGVESLMDGATLSPGPAFPWEMKGA